LLFHVLVGPLMQSDALTSLPLDMQGSVPLTDLIILNVTDSTLSARPEQSSSP
jgi:hypothetical protein